MQRRFLEFVGDNYTDKAKVDALVPSGNLLDGLRMTKEAREASAPIINFLGATLKGNDDAQDDHARASYQNAWSPALRPR